MQLARTGRMRPLNPSIGPGHPGSHARADDAGSENPREGPAKLAANRTYRLSLARLREALVKTGFCVVDMSLLSSRYEMQILRAAARRDRRKSVTADDYPLQPGRGQRCGYAQPAAAARLHRLGNRPGDRGHGRPVPGTETGRVRICPVRGPLASRWRFSVLPSACATRRSG